MELVGLIAGAFVILVILVAAVVVVLDRRRIRRVGVKVTLEIDRDDHAPP